MCGVLLAFCPSTARGQSFELYGSAGPTIPMRDSVSPLASKSRWGGLALLSVQRHSPVLTAGQTRQFTGTNVYQEGSGVLLTGRPTL